MSKITIKTTLNENTGLKVKVSFTPSTQGLKCKGTIKIRLSDDSEYYVTHKIDTTKMRRLFCNPETTSLRDINNAYYDLNKIICQEFAPLVTPEQYRKICDIVHKVIETVDPCYKCDL